MSLQTLMATVHTVHQCRFYSRKLCKGKRKSFYPTMISLNMCTAHQTRTHLWPRLWFGHIQCCLCKPWGKVNTFIFTCFPAEGCFLKVFLWCHRRLLSAWECFPVEKWTFKPNSATNSAALLFLFFAGRYIKLVVQAVEVTGWVCGNIGFKCCFFAASKCNLLLDNR